MSLPLFPLHTVLLPGGLLPLRIFEARYIDMVRDCLRNDSGFGICLIESGEEVGPAPRIHQLGTLTSIVDWSRRENGLLGIVAQGNQRIHVNDFVVEPNGLLVADVEPLPEEQFLQIPAEYASLAGFLQRLISQLGEPYSSLLNNTFEDAFWVGARLTELLPLPAIYKQRLYELDDPLQRLDELQRTLRDGLN